MVHTMININEVSEMRNVITDKFNEKLSPNDHVFEVYVFKANKQGIRHCSVETENNLEIECNVSNCDDSVENLKIELLRARGWCEVSVGPFKGESMVTIGLDNIPFEKWRGNNGAVTEKTLDNGFTDKNEEPNTEQWDDMGPTAGDEVRESLEAKDISEICPDEYAPDIDFLTDFLNDPLELIKLHGYINNVSGFGSGFQFGRETVYDKRGKEYYFEYAYVNPRFDDILEDLVGEINEWLDCTEDEIEWVWDRDKWDEYKERWYSAHGIHEYGKTPYVA